MKATPEDRNVAVESVGSIHPEVVEVSGTVVYSADQAHKNTFQTFIGAIKNIVARRELLRILIGRDLVAMHKKSFLGLAWTVITPALSIMSFVLLRLTGVLKTGQTLSQADYIIYVLAGTTIFNIMRATSGQVSRSIAGNQGLLLQIKFPRELMVVKHLALALVTSSVGIVVTMLFAVIFGFRPSLDWVLFFPSLIPITMVGLSVGILMALAAVIALDIDRFVDILWGFLFVAVPVIYERNETLDPPFDQLLFWNPFTHLVEYPRHLMMGSPIYDIQGYAVSSALALLLFAISWHAFSRTEARLMERLV